MDILSRLKEAESLIFEDLFRPGKDAPGRDRHVSGSAGAGPHPGGPLSRWPFRRSTSATRCPGRSAGDPAGERSCGMTRSEVRAILEARWFRCAGIRSWIDRMAELFGRRGPGRGSRRGVDGGARRARCPRQ